VFVVGVVEAGIGELLDEVVDAAVRHEKRMISYMRSGA
jgi:hypothetical protein